MSEHLPECDWNNACHWYKEVRAEGIIDRTWQNHNDHYKVGRCVQCGVECMCDRLRACEERMRAACIKVVEEIEHGDGLVWWERFRDNPNDPNEVTIMVPLADTLDALREVQP